MKDATDDGVKSLDARTGDAVLTKVEDLVVSVDQTIGEATQFGDFAFESQLDPTGEAFVGAFAVGAGPDSLECVFEQVDYGEVAVGASKRSRSRRLPVGEEVRSLPSRRNGRRSVRPPGRTGRASNCFRSSLPSAGLYFTGETQRRFLKSTRFKNSVVWQSLPAGEHNRYYCILTFFRQDALTRLAEKPRRKTLCTPFQPTRSCTG